MNPGNIKRKKPEANEPSLCASLYRKLKNRLNDVIAVELGIVAAMGAGEGV